MTLNKPLLMKLYEDLQPKERRNKTQKGGRKTKEGEHMEWLYGRPFGKNGMKWEVTQDSRSGMGNR